ncbi:MAG: START domain-containing protein [Ketobacteraceae bacterium]|nr:START domain-containing protein [Ketobacteraceae bacterium]
MNMRIMMIAALTTLLLPVQAMADWELQQDKDGIRVFTKALPDSDFDAFKAETIIDTRLSTLMAVHFDVNSVKDWMKNCDESRLLSDDISPAGYTAYFRTDSPWPLDDRDYTLNYDIQQDPEDLTVTLSFHSVTDLVPENDGVVRVTELEGFWKMTPLKQKGKQDQDGVSVTYQVKANPGGNVPAWLANSFAVEQPFESLQNLRQQVKQDKYKSKHFSFIKEKIPE